MKRYDQLTKQQSQVSTVTYLYDLTLWNRGTKSDLYGKYSWTHHVSTYRHHFFDLLRLYDHSWLTVNLISVLKSRSLVISHSKVRNSSSQALWNGKPTFSMANSDSVEYVLCKLCQLFYKQWDVSQSKFLVKIFCIVALGSGQRLLYRLGSGLGLVPVLVLVFCTSLTKLEVISITVGVCLYFAMFLKGYFLTDFTSILC